MTITLITLRHLMLPIAPEYFFADRDTYTVARHYVQGILARIFRIATAQDYAARVNRR